MRQTERCLTVMIVRKPPSPVWSGFVMSGPVRYGGFNLEKMEKHLVLVGLTSEEILDLQLCKNILIKIRV